MQKKEDVVMAARSVGRQFIASKSDLACENDRCQERVIHADHMLAVRQNHLNHGSATRLAALFAVLSDPTRLQVLYALLRAPTGELCVCDLATGLGRDDTTISHQLRVMRNQKVVAMRKVGRVVYYRLVDEHIRQLLELGLTHTCEPVLHEVNREAQVPA